MASPSVVYTACEPYAGGFDGTYWTNIDGSDRLEMARGGIVRRNGKETTCTVRDETTALLFFSTNNTCEQFHRVTNLERRLTTLQCPRELLPAQIGPRAFATVDMRPLTPGTYPHESIHLRITVDQQHFTLNGPTGQSSQAEYRGTIVVRQLAWAYQIDVDLTRSGDLSLFPKRLLDRQFRPIDRQRLDAQLRLLPVTLVNPNPDQFHDDPEAAPPDPQVPVLSQIDNIPARTYLQVMIPGVDRDADRQQYLQAIWQQAVREHTAPRVVLERALVVFERDRLSAAGCLGERYALARDLRALAVALEVLPIPAPIDARVTEIIRQKSR